MTKILLTLATSFTILSSVAQDVPSIVGQNDWLYYRHEISDASDNPAVNTTVDLIRRINAVFKQNDIALVVAMAPLKIRIHSENLPLSLPLSDYLKGNYATILKKLRDGGVSTADINTAFQNSPVRTSPMPLFFKQDTHWSSSGALLGAETVRDAINSDAGLKRLLESTPTTAYTLTWSPKDWPVQGDLAQQLPKGTLIPGKELIKIFTVEKGAGSGEVNLLGGNTTPITLLGSSYTADWTNFPIAMRYALQRDLLSISVDALQGQWVGLHTYLRDDSFQLSPPKLLIWEMPERDMRAPPDLKWREARNIMDNTEWLLQASALIQQKCVASGIQSSVELGSLTAGKSSTVQDFVEINFDKPVERLSYLSAKIQVAGSKTITIEASGNGAAARKFTLPVAGDDAEHNLRTALLSKGKGFTKIRLFPGTATSFSLKDVQLCAQPEDLLR